jgi:hypothetical protein
MVQRHACRIEIWDETEVTALAKGGSRASRRLVADLPVEEVAPTDGGVVGGTKYAALSAWLVGEERQTIEASFRDIEEVLGFPLPPSSRRHAAHWSGYKGSAVVRRDRLHAMAASQNLLTRRCCPSWWNRQPKLVA